MGLLYSQKVRRPDSGLGTAYPDVLFTPHLCLHKNTIILPDLGQWGGKGNTLYQWRDLQSLQSLEKKRIQLCRENKPEGSRVQRAAGPKRVPLGFTQRAGSRRKLYHRAEEAQRVGLFSNKSGIFLIHKGHSLSASIQTWGETIQDFFHWHYVLLLFLK